MFPNFTLASTYKSLDCQSSIHPPPLQPTVQPSPYSVHPIQCVRLFVHVIQIFSHYTFSAREINFPVVLIHGFSDLPGLTGTWVAVEKVLCEEAGVPKSDILTVQIPPLKSIEERTKSAVSAITAKFSGKSVHLIAHSMVCSFQFLVLSIVNCHFVGWIKCSRYCCQIWNRGAQVQGSHRDHFCEAHFNTRSIPL